MSPYLGAIALAVVAALFLPPLVVVLVAINRQASRERADWRAQWEKWLAYKKDYL